MNEKTESKPRIKKAKIFAVTITDGNGKPLDTVYIEHYSKPQAQTAVLENRVVVVEADHHDLIRIGRDGLKVLRSDTALDSDQADAFATTSADEYGHRD